MAGWRPPAPAPACVRHLAAQSATRTRDASADELAVNLLQMFGLPRVEAREIAGRPLPKA